MPFNDTSDGQTHYYGDGCKPPHEKVPPNTQRTGDEGNKIILDLCGGTGAWSKPYKDAGYDVQVITLPTYDLEKTNIMFDRFEFHSLQKRHLWHSRCTTMHNVLNGANSSKNSKRFERCNENRRNMSQDSLGYSG